MCTHHSPNFFLAIFIECSIRRCDWLVSCCQLQQQLRSFFEPSPFANQIYSDWEGNKVDSFKRKDVRCSAYILVIKDSERKAGIMTETLTWRDWEKDLTLWQWRTDGLSVVSSLHQCRHPFVMWGGENGSVLQSGTFSKWHSGEANCFYYEKKDECPLQECILMANNKNALYNH